MRQLRHSYHVNVVKCGVSYIESHTFYTDHMIGMSYCRTLVGPPLISKQFSASHNDFLSFGNVLGGPVHFHSVNRLSELKRT